MTLYITPSESPIFRSIPPKNMEDYKAIPHPPLLQTMNMEKIHTF